MIFNNVAAVAAVEVFCSSNCLVATLKSLRTYFHSFCLSMLYNLLQPLCFLFICWRYGLNIFNPSAPFIISELTFVLAEAFRATFAWTVAF